MLSNPTPPRAAEAAGHCFCRQRSTAHPMETHRFGTCEVAEVTSEAGLSHIQDCGQVSNNVTCWTADCVRACRRSPGTLPGPGALPGHPGAVSTPSGKLRDGDSGGSGGSWMVGTFSKALRNVKSRLVRHWKAFEAWCKPRSWGYGATPHEERVMANLRAFI